MPAVSERQRRFFGAERSRLRKGKKTKTGLSLKTLREFTRKPKGGFRSAKRSRKRSSRRR